MTKIAVWCRHEEDCIIGIGPKIPWNIPSDLKRFRRITENANIVCGQTTYESFPNRTLPNREIYVLTFNENYEVSNPQKHHVINDMMELKDFEAPLYIAGGASIYKLFMQKMAPEIVVDSCNHNPIDENLSGNPVDIKECIDKLAKDYIKILPDYEEDNVTTSVWIKKDEFVPQEILKHISVSIINKKQD